MITSPPDRDDYLLTINSECHAGEGTSVDFRVRVLDLNISLSELDSSEYQDWEVGVESVSALNNGEAFHSIDEKNQSIQQRGRVGVITIIQHAIGRINATRFVVLWWIFAKRWWLCSSLHT